MLNTNYVARRIEMAKEEVDLMDLHKVLTTNLEDNFKGRMEILDLVTPAFLEKGFERLLSDITYNYMVYTREMYIDRFDKIFKNIADEMSEGNIISKYFNFLKWQKDPSFETIQNLYDFTDSLELRGKRSFAMDVENVMNNLPRFESEDLDNFVFAYTKRYMALMMERYDSDAVSGFISMHMTAAVNKACVKESLGFIEGFIDENRDSLNRMELHKLFEKLSDKFSNDSSDYKDMEIAARCLEKAYAYAEFGFNTKDHASIVAKLMLFYAAEEDSLNELFWTKIFCENHFDEVEEEHRLQILEHYVACLEWASTQKTDLRIYTYNEYLKGFMELILERPNEIYLAKWVRSIMKLAKRMLAPDYIKLWASSIMELPESNGDIKNYLEFNVNLLEDRDDNTVITLKKNM